MADKKGLIEELAALAGCTYLSDLHLSSRRAQVAKAANEIGTGHYSAADWCEAYRYVMGTSMCQKGETVAEETARHRFIEELRAER